MNKGPKTAAINGQPEGEVSDHTYIRVTNHVNGSPMHLHEPLVFKYAIRKVNFKCIFSETKAARHENIATAVSFVFFQAIERMLLLELLLVNNTCEILGVPHYKAPPAVGTNLVMNASSPSSFVRQKESTIKTRRLFG